MRKILLLLIILMMSVSAVSALTYDQMVRYPDQNIGLNFSLVGEVVELTISSEKEAWGFRLYTKECSYTDGYCDDDVYVVFMSAPTSPRVVEGDIIEVKGSFHGDLTYETVLGAERTIPLIEGETYSIIDTPSTSSTKYEPPTKTQTQKPVQTDTVTMGERNAAKKALDYLDYMAFSRSGLIKQLEYEGFTKSEAIYGTDQSGADWDDQAAKKALDYLDYMAFSRDGLIEQLEYEGFTHSQAVYGVNSVGY